MINTSIIKSTNIRLFFKITLFPCQYPIPLLTVSYTLPVCNDYYPCDTEILLIGNIGTIPAGERDYPYSIPIPYSGLADTIPMLIIDYYLP